MSGRDQRVAQTPAKAERNEPSLSVSGNHSRGTHLLATMVLRLRQVRRTHSLTNIKGRRVRTHSGCLMDDLFGWRYEVQPSPRVEHRSHLNIVHR